MITKGWGAQSVSLPPLWFFQNCIFLREGKALFFLVTFNITIRPFFSWNHWNFSSRVEDMNIFFVNINYFHQYFGLFGHFLFANEQIDVVSIFYLKPTSNRLFNNCIKLFWYWINSSWNMKGKRGCQIDLPQKKLPSKSPTLLW